MMMATLPEVTSASEMPDVVNAHTLLAARPMPAHSAGVCMRGASCVKVAVKNVTKKARAQVKDDKAQVGVGAGFHGQDRDGGKYRDAEHDEAHVATLGKIKDDTGDETARRQKEARPGLYGDGAVGVGERDDVIERREQAGENHDERDTPARLLGEGVRGLGKGIDGGTGALVCRLGSGAEGGDGDSRCAKDDELCDTAAIEQVDGELHQDARGIGCPRTGGKLGVILECQRKGVVSGGAQQAEPEECEASQNLERKRARGGLNLSQPQDGDGDGGTDNCLRLAFVLRVLKQRSVPDKAEHARAQNKALCEHNALGAGE